MTRLPLLASLSALTVLSASMALAQGIKDYSPVTADRLKNPEPGNWLSIRRTYDGQAHSPLKQIAASNVAGLKEVWKGTTGPRQKVTSFAALPAAIANQAPPLINNGTMIVSAGDNQVIAFDPKDGKEFWRYKWNLPQGLVPVHPTNRGVALWEDKVYFATLDAHLVALDAKTGTKLWDRALEDWQSAYYSTLAPLVVNGKVMVGVSGGEFGIRGFVVAFDAKTGEQVWKTYTIPSPDQSGGNT